MTHIPNVMLCSIHSKYHNVSRGGAESSMRVMGEKLVQKGAKVCYFTNGISRFPGTRRQTINGVDVYFFTPWRWPLFNKKYFPTISAKFVGMQRRKALGRILKTNKIQVIYAYETFPVIFDLLEIRKNMNLDYKIVHRIAGSHWTVQIRSGDASPSVFENTFNQVNVLNFLAQKSETVFDEKCKELGITVKKPKRISGEIGVDFSTFTRRNRIPENRCFTIVCVARFADYAKRQDLLIDALSLMADNRFRIEFVSTGKLLEHYKKRTSDENISPWVHFHGYLKGKQYSDTIKKADLFALPTDHEGLGKSVIEAMAMGVPVLVSDVPPLNAYISHNQTGFLAQNTPEKWAEAITVIRQDRDRLNRVAEAGHAYARKHFDADQAIHKYIDLFSDICS